MHYHAHCCVAFNDIFHVLLCVNKQPHACACTRVFMFWRLLLAVCVCVCVNVWSYGFHTAAPDLQPTSDPILCGGSEALLTVMASTLKLSAVKGHKESNHSRRRRGRDGPMEGRIRRQQ